MSRRLSNSFTWKVCLVIAFLFSFTLAPAINADAAKTTKTKTKVAKKGTNTFAKPDFAYPVTVQKNAEAVYKDALAKRDGLKGILAAIQLGVASNSIDQEKYMNSTIARFDTLASVMPSPWNTMALLYEAKIYNDIYDSESWLFDGRKLPLDRVPDNVSEWSGDMVAAKVYDLVKQAADRSASLSMPLKDVAGLLTNSDQAVAAGMTVADFVALEGASLLGNYSGNGVPLRFGTCASLTPKEKCMDLRDRILENAVKANVAAGNVAIRALFCGEVYKNISYAPRKMKYLEECYKDFGDTPYGARFVADYARGLYEKPLADGSHLEGKALNEARSKALGIVRAYDSKFPDAQGSGEVKDLIESLTAEKVLLEYENAVLPGKDWKCRVTASGMYDFFVLIYKFPDECTDEYMTRKELQSKGTFVTKIPVKLGGQVPDVLADSIMIPGLRAGNYALYASRTGDISGIIADNGNYYSSRMITVSGISYFYDKDRLTGDVSIYVVNALNQQPVEGASVKWTETAYRGKGTTQTFISNAEGRVMLPRKEGKVFVRKGDDFAFTSYWTNTPWRSGNDAEKCGYLLTDLSIYKPGSTVGFVCVAAMRRGNRFSELSGHEVRVILENANYQAVDTLTLKSDSYGRVSGSFRLPESGLLGTYRLRMSIDGNNVDSESVEVADYKTPTFRVETGKLAGSFKLGDVLGIDGKAFTYSGMPVIGGKVDYTVTYRPWRWCWGMSENERSCHGTTSTDEEGKFKISLPTETLRDTPYSKGLFTLEVTVTDNAGETQKAQSVMFSLASAYSINADIPALIDADGSDFGNVTVSDMTGKPVEKTVYYKITDSRKKEVAGGEFLSGGFKPDFRSLASGEYSLLFSLQSNLASTDECANETAQTVIWRASDKRPPVTTALWVPLNTINLAANQKSVSVSVGSSYDDSYIYYTIDNGEKRFASEWVKVSDGFAQVKVDAPGDYQQMFVKFAGMHALEGVQAGVKIVPWSQQKRVSIETETFRDNLEPGAKEKWSFRFMLDGKPMVARPVMAVMSNKALNAISPFSWSFNPYGTAYWSSITSLDTRSPSDVDVSFRHSVSGSKKNYKRFEVPGLYTYGSSLYSGRRVYEESAVLYDVVTVAPGVQSNGMRMKSARVDRSMSAKQSRATGAVKGESDSFDLAEEEATEDSGMGGSQNDTESTQVRPVECPLAFFMPDMVTDNTGLATLDFLVPHYNGTWQFQIAGYDSEMRGDVKMLDAVASKRVMVQMNAPRFLRTGDKAGISATLFNNSGKSLPLAGRMEILSPDGKVLASREFEAVETKASGSRTVTLEYNVPADISAVLVRAYASGAGHTDGEGTEIAVLPSSTPVLESSTFYAGPDRQSIKVQLPDNVKDANVTLQYSGNAIWECVTALPEILTPDSKNVLSLVSALFGNAIADGLIKKYPQLGEALKTFAAPENVGDSTLVSNLQKNASMKAVELGNTPWVNDAVDETRRMASLIKYADSAAAAAAIEDIMRELKNRQNNDGGWSWCDNMPTSEYITCRVLLHFAMLKGMGFLPEDGDEMAGRAFGYVDRELVKSWERTEKKYFSVSGMLNYLYVKSFFPKVGDATGFAPLRAKALKAIADGWKDFDIYDKATAVTLEHRLGNNALAGDILESLRQFASVSPEKGMCFENLRGMWSGWNPLVTTAQVLEAYAEVSPADKAVDQLRQWLVLSKQTQNWSEMRGTAEVIQAILASGSDWTQPSREATLMIGGREVSVPARAKITDSFTVNLTAEQVKAGGIEICKYSSSPAWGGVVSQYVAPILDVKSEGVPQLRIEKNVYPIKDGKAVAGELKVGDKVRVTLTITADRDLEYVAVLDGRSSCLEPAEQLSGYTSSDGVWYYREVRDAATNLFIPFLGKGTHVISYECYVDRAGVYTLGIAQAQSQYAPVISAHSEGVRFEVKP